MGTKDKILATALELFNTEGVKEVTLRRIALAMEISQGNLNYHFRTKSDIVRSLYYRLVAEMDNEMNQVVRDQPVLSLLHEQSLRSMKILYAYRFILQDLYKVLSADKALKKHYLELQKVRQEQFGILFQAMGAEGLIRAEEFPGEYERLHARMNILGDNWINAANLFQKGDRRRIEYYHGLLFEVIYPYLTRKGKKEYREVCSSVKI